MKNLIITIVLSILLFSCSKAGAGDITGSDITGGVDANEKLLKISTYLYGTDAETGDNYVKISVSNSGGTTSTTHEDMAKLNAGIKFKTDSVVTIKVHDKAGAEEYANDILWTGYTFDAVDDDTQPAKKKEIEITMDKDINLTLITAKDDKTPVNTANLFVTLVAPENITDAGVKINSDLYTTGSYELLFAHGQSVAFEVMMPANTNIIFTGFNFNGEDLGTNGTFLIRGDSIAEASFVDKSAANITVIIKGVKPSDGKIYVNGNLIEQADANNLVDYEITNQSIGQRITLKAEPASNKKFISWSDNLVAYLSDKEEYQYVVTEDSIIKTVFTAPAGVLTVSFKQNTNYYTGTNQHKGNEIKYTVKDADGTIQQESDGTSKPHLTWNNNQISGLAANYKIDLVAIPGQGFYPKGQDDKVKWTGAITGNGLKKSITLNNEGTSQAPSVDFEIEKRTITVELDNKKEQTNTGSTNTWVAENTTTDDEAKGYSITINGQDFKDVKKASRILDWHTKVSVTVAGGTHYEATNTIIQGASGKNPEEGYNNGVVGARINTLSFDLENNNTTTAVLHHKQVNMLLRISGGKFDTAIDKKYDGFINVSGTGDAAKDIKYETLNWNDGNNEIVYGQYIVPVMSGTSVAISANPNTATLFRRHSATAPLIAFGFTTNTNVVVKNAGEPFTVSSDFYAPIWTLTLNMMGNIKNGDKLTVEPAEYKAGEGNYSYEITPLAGAKSTVIEESKQFQVTNGLPTAIKAIADTTGHYAFSSISGADAGVATRDVIATAHTSIQIDFIHNERDMKLHILGGKDDRSQSHVRVSGTGFSAYNKTYYASNRNAYLDNVAIAPVVYKLKVLSGITNVKIEAVTSKVHNFDKIRTITGGTVVAVGTQKRGQNTYSQTNSSTIVLVTKDNTQEVEVQFRINSLKGGLTGLKDDTTFNVILKKTPFLNNSASIPTYEVYSADELYTLSETANTFKGKSIRLMNDIYMGGNGESKGDAPFKGFATTFSGKFVGDGKAIYDLDSPRAVFHHIDGASINGLTTARGLIEGSTNTGVIGIAQNSILKNITNSATVKGVDYVGGIIGNARGGNEVSFLGNYGAVAAFGDGIEAGDGEGPAFVGGVIGNIEAGAGYKYTYMFNRGNVQGDNRVGGVIGAMSGAVTRASKIYNTGNVNGNLATGGLVGYMGWSRSGDTSGDLEIQDFYSTGNVLNGGDGVVGTIAGSRRIFSVAFDWHIITDAMRRGYSIGDISGNGIVGQAGHNADTGWHYINVYDTWYYSANNRGWRGGGVVHSTWLDGRLNGNSKESVASAHGSGQVKPSGGTNLNTSLTAFSDSTVWVQKSGLPDVNGFTSRPMLKGFEETSLPAYMMDIKK